MSNLRISSAIARLGMGESRRLHQDRGGDARFARVLEEAGKKPAQTPTRAGGPAVTQPAKQAEAPAAPAPPGRPAAFESWFEPVRILSAFGEDGAYTMTKPYGVTAEGAAEALRLVQQHVPEATLEGNLFGGWPWASDKPMYQVVLPGGHKMGAGLILWHYYNLGSGASPSSETDLKAEIAQLRAQEPLVTT